jgi:hypothetical protein
MRRRCSLFTETQAQLASPRMYYQYSPQRLSTCPLTIHALLHIADSIKANGPVWAYWAFPMERFCGRLQLAITSRRFPFSSIDRYVINSSRLNQCKLIYNLAHELDLISPHSGTVQGELRCPKCVQFIFLTDISTYAFEIPHVSYCHHIE